MGTILQKLDKVLDTKEAIRQAIAAKGQEVPGSTAFSAYPAKIAAIPTGVDTSDATATEDDIAFPKTAYVDGKKITGAVSVTSPDWTYYPPTGGSLGTDISPFDKSHYITATQETAGDRLLRSGSRTTITIPAEDFGDADAADVVAGKTFTSAAGVKLEGSLEPGVDTSDATATADLIVSGYTAYAKGKKVTGKIPMKGSSNLTASGATVTVPAGWYPSNASKSVATATQATPSITIDYPTGAITASAAQTAGYVSSGTKSATEYLAIQEAKTVTPGTAAQVAVKPGFFATGPVTVAGDANLVPENIKSGVSIFGVEGEYGPALRTATATYDASTKTLTAMLDTTPTLLIVRGTATGTLPNTKGLIYEVIYMQNIPTSTLAVSCNLTTGAVGFAHLPVSALNFLVSDNLMTMRAIGSYSFSDSMTYSVVYV